MAALDRDPDTIKLVEQLVARGLGTKAIAERLEVSVSTVRKIVEPGFVERERQRHKDVDKVRAPLRRADPEYRAYHKQVDDTDQHRERTRRANQRRRRGEEIDPATWTEAATRLRNAAEHVSAEERRRAAETEGVVVGAA